MDDIEREDIGELLGELDSLRQGEFATLPSLSHPLEKAWLAELAGRAADYLDDQLRWRDAAETVLLNVTVGSMPALNAVAIAAAKGGRE